VETWRLSRLALARLENDAEAGYFGSTKGLQCKLPAAP
jgi:hypothetical protein